jgi:hypothetical protein
MLVNRRYMTQKLAEAVRVAKVDSAVVTVTRES